MIQEKMIPNGYGWDSKNGLHNLKQQKKLVNAIPKVRKKRKIIFQNKEQSSIVLIDFQLEFQDGSESEIITLSDKQLLANDFTKYLPVDVILQPRATKIVTDLYRVIIQEQLIKIKAEEEIVYEFGWNDMHYHWDENQKLKLGNIYESTVNLANLIISNEIIAGTVLAAIHGPMVYVLKQAGIEHNYVTFVVGKTGIGKTDVVKKICNYLPGKNIFLSLGSDGRALKKQIHTLNDITLIIDDFCNSASKELERKNARNISDIIQNASDSGNVLINGTELMNQDKNIHLIITGEKVIKNFSTINRCFVVSMDEMLDESTWDLLTTFSGNRSMYVFMKSFIGWIETEGVDYINKIKVNYQEYLKQSKQKLVYQIPGINRIRNTIAVNMTIQKCLIDFLTQQGIDDYLLKRVKTIMPSCVWKSGKVLCESIQKDIAESKKMRYLPAIADILINIGNGYWVAEDMKEYRKNKYFLGQNGECIGVCLHDGYWSVEPKILSACLSDFLDEEDIPVKSISVELNEYSLARVDGEKKISCRWGNDTRMYHIKVRELLELFRPESNIYRICDHFKSDD